MQQLQIALDNHVQINIRRCQFVTENPASNGKPKASGTAAAEKKILIWRTSGPALFWSLRRGGGGSTREAQAI
jgi:hypothetical protein